MGVELPLRVVVTILECCVTFSGVKLSIRSFVLFLLASFYVLYAAKAIYIPRNFSCRYEIVTKSSENPFYWVIYITIINLYKIM